MKYKSIHTMNEKARIVKERKGVILILMVKNERMESNRRVCYKFRKVTFKVVLRCLNWGWKQVTHEEVLVTWALLKEKRGLRLDPLFRMYSFTITQGKQPTN